MKYYLILIAFVSSTPALAHSYQTNNKIDALFENAKVQGTFIVFNLRESTYIAHNPSRAEIRYVPASTFKIPNSLIGLTVKAVQNIDEPLPYGGEPQPIKAWEKNMGLREAIKISNVPIYKELARRIGIGRMKTNVALMNYGNEDIGNTVDTFWLKGPLKISALEQTIFLSKLAQKTLPFPKEIQSTVHEIVKLEEGGDWKLYGKTGWADNIGWWVGWVNKNNNIFSFAVNIDMTDMKDAPKRIFLGKKSLQILGIID
jgi:beta-lactamase class D